MNFIQEFKPDEDGFGSVRIIKTVRTIEEINKAVESGFYPLLKKNVPNPELRVNSTLYQDSKGKVFTEFTVRNTTLYKLFGGTNEFSKLELDYLPGEIHSPFGAYLIPNDIKVGEKVFIEDLIENFVGAIYAQGFKTRLKSAFAIWNGNDFEIIHSGVSQVYG